MKSDATKFLFNIGNGTIKKVYIYSVNPLYLMFNKINAHFEEIHGNKYLTLIPPNESNEKIRKYQELWIKIRDFIKSVIKKSDDFDEKYMRINFDADDK